MAHQGTTNSTTNIVPTYTSGPTVQQEHSINVAITAQSGSSSTVISVSGTTNCSATTTSITVNYNAPVSGTYSASFRNVYAYVFGTPVYATTTISGTIAQSPDPTAPTVSATQTFPATEAASATGAVTLSSAGTGNDTDVFQYALFPYNTSSNFSYTNSFSITRGSSYSYGAARERYNGTDRVFASYVTNILFPYLAADTTAAATSSTISSTATTATTTVSGITGAGMQVAVRLNNGSANIVTGVGNVTLTIPSASLPTGTNTTTYEIFTLRPVANGGNASWTATNDTFTVTREAAPVPPPTSINLFDVGTQLASTSITATVAGPSGGTLRVGLMIDGSSVIYFDSPKTFTGLTRGLGGSGSSTTYKFWAYNSVPPSWSTTINSGFYSVPYLAADTTNISATSSTISSTATTATTTVGGTTGTGMQVAVRLNNGSANIVTGVGNVTLTIPSASLPSGTNTITYEIFTLRPVANGGNASWTATNTTFTVTRSAASDTEPDEFGTTANGFHTYTDRTTSTAVESLQITLAGTTAPAPISVSVPTGSTTGTPQYRFAANTTALDSASYISSGPNIPVGYVFQFKVTTSSSNSATVAGTLNIGGVTGTITATTEAASGGGDGGGEASDGDYGVECRNGSDVVVLSPSRRTTNFISSGNGTLAAGGVTDPALSAEGMTTDNSTDIAVLIDVPAQSFFAPSFSIGRGSNVFTITNNSSVSFDYTYVVVRY